MSYLGLWNVRDGMSKKKKGFRNHTNLTPLWRTNTELHGYSFPFSFLTSIPSSDLSSTDQSEHGFQRCKNVGSTSDTNPRVPPRISGLGLVFDITCGEKKKKKRHKHMESIGAAGRHGMESDKTGCPSSFPLNAGPKSILLPAWDFLQPKFWVNPISCPQDWDVVCQRRQSSLNRVDAVRHF